jgi:hypothetical protein
MSSAFSGARGAACDSIKPGFPILGDAALRSGNWLVLWVRARLGKSRASHELSRVVVIEPILAGFKTRDDRVMSRVEVPGCMPFWRIVTAADVSTLRAAAQVQPPAVLLEAFHAAGARRFGVWIDAVNMLRHISAASFIVPGVRAWAPQNTPIARSLCYRLFAGSDSVFN